MAAPTFDSTRAVRFDLSRGAVVAGASATDLPEERLLLVPSSAIDELVGSASAEAVESLGRALGRAIGRRVATRVGERERASVEHFVTQLAGEAALAGIGALSVERWGRALVVVFEDTPVPTRLLAPIVSSALEAASGRPVAAALLMRGADDARVIVASERGVARVSDWIASGIPWGEALTRLQAGS